MPAKTSIEARRSLPATASSPGFRRAGSRLSWWRVFAGLPVLLVVGCDSLRGPHEAVVLPAVRGRVLDAETQQPIAGARVERSVGTAPRTPPALEHAAERSQRPAPVRTGKDGRFRFVEVRSGYLLFEHSPAWLVTLTVSHGHYLNLSTNLDLLQWKPVETPQGAFVEAGDLWLVPRKPR